MRGGWICSALRFPLCRRPPSRVWWKPTMSLCRGHRGTAVTIVTVEAGPAHSVGGRTCPRPARTTQGSSRHGLIAGGIDAARHSPDPDLAVGRAPARGGGGAGGPARVLDPLPPA